MIDLGVGTPEKDDIIIEALMDKKKFKKVRFIPFDISQNFIGETVRYVHTVAGNRGHIIRDKNTITELEITPFFGDFSKMGNEDYVEEFSSIKHKIIAFLGGTVGNFEIKYVPETFKKIVGESDCLIVDLVPADYYHIEGNIDREIDEKKIEKLLGMYNTPVFKAFAVEPLRLFFGEEIRIDSLINSVEVEVKTVGKEWEGEHCNHTITKVVGSVAVLSKLKVEEQHAEIINRVSRATGRQKKCNLGELRKGDEISLVTSVRYPIKKLENEYKKHFGVRSYVTSEKEYVAFVLEQKTNADQSGEKQRAENISGGG